MMEEQARGANGRRNGGWVLYFADEDIIEVAIFMDACLRLFTFLA